MLKQKPSMSWQRELHLRELYLKLTHVTNILYHHVANMLQKAICKVHTKSTAHYL